MQRCGFGLRTADTNLTMSFPLASNSHRSQKVSTEIRANQTWGGERQENCEREQENGRLTGQFECIPMKDWECSAYMRNAQIRIDDI